MKTLKTLLIRISIRIPLEINLMCCNITMIFFPCCTGYERFSGHRVVTSLVSIKNCYSSRISSFFMSCFVFLFSLLSLYLFFFFFGMYLLSLWLICSYSRDSLVHVSFNPTASQSPRCYCKFCKVIFLLSYLF